MSDTFNYRDLSIPLSEEELASMVKIFKSMPTFEDDTISSIDSSAVLKAMDFRRSPEQHSAYEKYWDSHFGGRIPLQEAILIFKSLHEIRKWFRVLAAHFDRNKDGFIDAGEFKDVLELSVTHDPTLAGLTYEQFVKEANVNNDGRVSIEQCADWMENHAQK